MNLTGNAARTGSVLVVDGIRDEAERIKGLAEKDGYSAVIAGNGTDGRKIFCRNYSDIIILDLQIRDADSIGLIKDLRKCYRTPLVAVSSDGSEEMLIRALEAGADDFIVRPFGDGELTARVRNAVRHCSDGCGERGCFSSGDLTVDFMSRTVSHEGKQVHLTQTEFSIIEILAANAGKTLSYSYIISRIWGDDIKDAPKALRVNMTNIRRKIEKDTSDPVYIITENGIGFRMNKMK